MRPRSPSPLTKTQIDNICAMSLAGVLARMVLARSTALEWSAHQVDQCPQSVGDRLCRFIVGGYRLVEFSFGTGRVTETEGEVHRAQDGDLSTRRAARLGGEFGENGLRVGSALLPSDRHRLDDLRRQTASGGYCALGQHFGES